MCIYMAGVVNYCVPAGEAYQKALELAREINQKVRCHWNNYVLHVTTRSFFTSENSQQYSIQLSTCYE